MITFLLIKHNGINEEDLKQMNKYLKNNGVKWFENGTDLESELQFISYIVCKGANFDQIKSYPWPSWVINADFYSRECESDIDTDEEFGIPHRKFKH